MTESGYLQSSLHPLGHAHQMQRPNPHSSHSFPSFVSSCWCRLPPLSLSPQTGPVHAAFEYSCSLSSSCSHSFSRWDRDEPALGTAGHSAAPQQTIQTVPIWVSQCVGRIIVVWQTMIILVLSVKKCIDFFWVWADHDNPFPECEEVYWQTT